MVTTKLPFLPSDAEVYNQAACPSRLILDRIADKWTTLIIGILAQSGHARFAQGHAAREPAESLFAHSDVEVCR